ARRFRMSRPARPSCPRHSGGRRSGRRQGAAGNPRPAPLAHQDGGMPKLERHIGTVETKINRMHTDPGALKGMVSRLPTLWTLAFIYGGVASPSARPL